MTDHTMQITTESGARYVLEIETATTDKITGWLTRIAEHELVYAPGYVPVRRPFEAQPPIIGERWSAELGDETLWSTPVVSIQ